MSSRTTTAENLTSCFDSLEALVESLTPEQWAVQSLCPDWDVAGVVGHVVGIEHALTGWMPEDAETPVPFAKVPEFEAKLANATPEEAVGEVKSVLAARKADLTNITDEQFASAAMTPIGPATYHRFMDVRVFDFWVHERDITTPLGLSTDDSGPAAVMALDEVHSSIGYIVGKKVGLPDGMSIAFHLTGPVERDIYAKVDGRATGVDELPSPSVEVTTDTLTFIQLACGRLDPQEPIDAGKISWTGNAEWGERAARNLRFTM